MADSLEQRVQIAGEKHLERVVFHPEPFGGLDAISSRELLGEMVIYRALQVIQFLLTDARDYRESILTKIFRQSDSTINIFSLDNLRTLTLVRNSPTCHAEYQTETEHIDFKFTKEADNVIAHFIVA